MIRPPAIVVAQSKLPYAARAAEAPRVAQRMNQGIDKSELWKLALAAFQNMRSLVIRNDRDSAKLFLAEEDKEAARIYYTDDEKLVGACAFYDKKYYFATNSTVPKEAKERHKEYLDAEKCVYVDEREPEQNKPYKHAEMKVFTATGGQAYIGVSKLCCLYCAAQLLAYGFTSFRGCSMVSFNNYEWMPDVFESSKYRAALWGEDVEKVVKKLGGNDWEAFLKMMSQGSTLLQKFREAHDKESTYPLTTYSKQNQIPYQLNDDF